MKKNFKRKSEFFNKAHFTHLYTQNRLEKHTAENPLGISGEIKKFSSEEVLQLATMCSHGMVLANLLEKVSLRLRWGKKDCEWFSRWTRKPPAR